MNEILMYSVAIPAFIVTMLGEYWWIHRRATPGTAPMRGYHPRDTAASLTLGIGYLVLSAGWKHIQDPFYASLYQMRVFEFDSSPFSWVLLFILQDFFFYWYHRTNHQHRILWAGHVNHHSSEHYNLSTALRQSWSSYVTSFLFYIPILFLGFHPAMLVTAALLHLFYQYWIHTETIGQLGLLEYILMTPSHHRVHHAVNGPYLDRNHGGMFIIWDKLFGTFEPEVETPVYGITTNIGTFNPVRIAFHEYAALWRDVREADSLRTALGYVFRAPGWQPGARHPATTDTPVQSSEEIFPAMMGGPGPKNSSPPPNAIRTRQP